MRYVRSQGAKRNARADGRDYVIERRAADHSANIGFRKHRFATDSPVEGSGFEPWVPPRKRRPWREVPRPTIVVSRDGLCLMTLQLIGPGSPFGNSRETFRKSGTDGSNPLPSSEESVSMQTSLSGRALPPRIGRLVLCGNPGSIGGVFSPRIPRVPTKIVQFSEIRDRIERVRVDRAY